MLARTQSTVLRTPSSSPTCGFQLSTSVARATLKEICRTSPGRIGRVNYTDVVENYPGFEPTSGMELALKLAQHAQRFGVEIRQEKVERLTIEDGVAVQTGKGSYEAPCAIIATGTRARTLGVDGEKELLGRGISLCAVCDGPLFKGKEVVVVGGGERIGGVFDYF